MNKLKLRQKGGQAYKKYKDSGVEWLGKIPKGWEVRKLKYICKVITGNTPSTNEESNFCDNGGCLWVKPDDLKDLSPIRSTTRYLTEKGLLKSHIVEEPAVLVNCIGNIGELGVVENTPFATNQQINSLVVKNKKLKFDFLKYLLSASKDEHKRYAKAVVVPIINASLEGNISLVLPPYQTQIMIVNYLDNKSNAIDKYIKKLKKQIKLLKEYRQKIISQAVTCGLDEDGKLRKKPEWKEGDPVPKGWKNSGVEWLGLIPEGWEVRKLGYLGEFRKGKGISKDKITKEGKPVILYGDIYTKYEVQTKALVRKAPISIVKDGEKIIPNDLLFTGSGETKEEIGKCVAYIGNKNGYAGGDTIIFQPKSLINSVFLSYLMYSSKYLSIKANLAKGQIIVHIYSSSLKNIEILLPPKQQQNAIVKYLDQISGDTKKQITKIEHQIDFIKEYKQSLISKVVTGKIDVKNINN